MARRKKAVVEPEITLEEQIAAMAAEQEAVEKCNDYTPPPAPVAKKDYRGDVAVSNAYTRLEVTHEEVEAYPKVVEQFENIGGVEAVIEYLRGSDDRLAKELVRLYDTYQNAETKALIPFEAYCVSAKVTKKKLFQLVMGEVCEQSDTASTLLAAAFHPQIVKKTIDVALGYGPDSGEARSVMHKHRGFLPTPKTQTVQIHGNLNQDNRQTTNNNATISVGELDLGFAKISKADDRFNEARIVKVEQADEKVSIPDQEYIP